MNALKWAKESMTKKKEIGFYSSILRLRCPKCRQETMFKKKGLFVFIKPLEMHENCSQCGQKYEIEPGFWLGALWTSYPIVVLIETPFIFYAISTPEISLVSMFALMIAIFLLLFPAITRLGRSIWAHIFIKYQAN